LQALVDFLGRCAFVEKSEGFGKIVASFRHALALACDIKFRAKRNIAFSFSLNDCG